ncbi:MAG TPA: 3-dehydroquinate synthase [bacterium]|nr:3-dehydroquinate synthase [bacterium]HPN43292.1 3-dehydroquinate synthase [bacterium]
MNKLVVNLDNRSYPIYIEPAIFKETASLLGQFDSGKEFFIITDSNVRPLYGDVLFDSLRNAGLSPQLLVVPAGEHSKSLQVAEDLYTQLLAARVTRQSKIIALGGGVIGDLAGFVAATLLRGVPFIQIPTTLLSQVDSSVGGKVGINHPLGKNLIGAFYQPQLVIIDPLVLKTLPIREIKAGLAEVIKYSFIANAGFFKQLSASITDIINLNDLMLVQDIISTCCQIKAEVVAKDERESGLRAILNFGHTIGHALETVTNYDYFLHGEAVAHGMRGALYLSFLHQYINKNELTRACALIASLEPPAIPTHITGEALVQAMSKDKKRSDKGQLWILLQKIGQYDMNRNVPAEMVKEAIDFILTGN